MKGVGSVRVRTYTEWDERMLRDGIKRCEAGIDRAIENVNLSQDARDRRIGHFQEWLDRYQATLDERTQGGS